MGTSNNRTGGRRYSSSCRGRIYRRQNNRPASGNQPASGTSNMPNMPTRGSSSSSNNDNETRTATDKVCIANFAFSPACITLAKGTTVTWINNTTSHTIVETDGKDGPSSIINLGSSYTRTFSQAGGYQYRCSIHPEAAGSVTLTE